MSNRGRPVARLLALDGLSRIEHEIAAGRLTLASRSGLDPAVRYNTESSAAAAYDIVEALDIVEAFDEGRG